MMGTASMVRIFDQQQQEKCPSKRHSIAIFGNFEYITSTLKSVPGPFPQTCDLISFINTYNNQWNYVEMYGL